MSTSPASSNEVPGIEAEGPSNWAGSSIIDNLHATPRSNVFNGFSDAWEHSPYSYGSTPSTLRKGSPQKDVSVTEASQTSPITVAKRGQRGIQAEQNSTLRRRSSAKIHALIHGSGSKLQKKSRVASPRASIISVQAQDVTNYVEEPKKSIFSSIKTKITTTLRGRK